MTTQGMTVAEILALPAAVDVPTAGLALGVGRNTAYEMARTGDLPVLRVGRQLRVRRATLLELLGITEQPTIRALPRRDRTDEVA